MGIQLPRVPGHEIVGQVVAVHPSETKWKIGQRVGGGWHGGGAAFMSIVETFLTL